jgi:hypothetical protein
VARSLAFWFDNPKDDPSVELHFNYWLLGSNNINYLDIGVKISPKGSYDSINLYLPFPYESTAYRPELGLTVCTDAQLLPAIFNSKISNKSDENHDTVEITFSNNDKLRFFTQIKAEEENSPSGVKVKPACEDGLGGLTLSFPRQLFSIQDADTSGYFRFRMVLGEEGQKSISHIYNSKDAYLTAHLETTELVDFRVNELRNIPSKIRSNLNEKSPISAVHFFLIREAVSEYKMSHSEYNRCRLLEKDLWNGYLGGNSHKNSDKIPAKMLIYHWKDVGKKGDDTRIDHFSAFAKFTKREVGIWKVIGIILTILFLGGTGSYFSNYIWNYTHEDVQFGKCVLSSSGEHQNLAIDTEIKHIDAQKLNTDTGSTSIKTSNGGE